MILYCTLTQLRNITAESEFPLSITIPGLSKSFTCLSRCTSCMFLEINTIQFISTVIKFLLLHQYTVKLRWRDLSFFSFSYLFAAVNDLLATRKSIIEKGKFYHGEATCSHGNFAPSFSDKFLSIFMHTSGSTHESISLIWVSLQGSFPTEKLEYRWCQFWSKVMMSEVKQRPTFIAAAYGQHRSQLVNKKTPKIQILRNSWCFLSFCLGRILQLYITN